MESSGVEDNFRRSGSLYAVYSMCACFFHSKAREVHHHLLPHKFEDLHIIKTDCIHNNDDFFYVVLKLPHCEYN